MPVPSGDAPRGDRARSRAEAVTRRAARGVGVVVDDHRESDAVRSSGRGSGRRPAAGASTSAPHRCSDSTRAGMPKPTAATSGAAARISSTASKMMSSVSDGPLHARSGAPGDAPRGPRPRHRRGASCLPRRRRSLAWAAWPDDIQRPCDRPRTRTPPEYNVYRARKRPLSRGGDLDALRRRLRRVREREPRRPAKPITPGRVSSGSRWRWPDGCCSRSCCSW